MNVRRLAPFFILFIFSIALLQTGCDTLVTENNEFRVYDTTIAVECFECHNDANNPLLRPKGQFENSAHANFALLDDNSCNILCHTHEGFLALVDTLETGLPLVLPELVSAITCYTCHSGHNFATPYGEWTMDSSSIRGREFTPTFAYNQGAEFELSNSCAHCHQATDDEVPNGLTDGGDYGPHFSPQADVVSGRFAAFVGLSDPTDPLNPLYSSHFENGCIKCHYGESGAGQGYKFAEHSFRLKDDNTDEMYFGTCQLNGCHGGVTMDQDFIDTSQYLTAISALADTVQMFLEAFEVLDPSDTTGRTINTATTRNAHLDSALYNFYLYSYDNSKGIHNPIFVKELLDTTKTVLDSLPPLISFAADAPLNCLNTDITFTPTVIGTFDSLEWNFGDNSTLVTLDENPVTHSYSTSGSYTILVTAYSEYTLDSLNDAGDSVIYEQVDGTGTVQIDNYISIEDKIIPSFALDTNGIQFVTPITICIGDSLHFVSTSIVDNNSPTYTWNFGYGTDEIISTDSISHIFDTVGTLSPMLAITTDCYDTTISITDLITVNGVKSIIDTTYTEDTITTPGSAEYIFTQSSFGTINTITWEYPNPADLNSTLTLVSNSLSITYTRDVADTDIEIILRVTSSDATCTTESVDTLSVTIPQQ